MTTITIALETTADSVIGGGIRLSPDNTIFSTNKEPNYCPVRELNLKRFGIQVLNLTGEISDVLSREDINFQIVNNNGSSGIGSSNTLDHPILSKSGILDYADMFPGLQQYIPLSIRFSQDTNIKTISGIISDYFLGQEQCVIKCPELDGGGDGVQFITIDGSLEAQIKNSMEYFNKKLGKPLTKDCIIQEYITQTAGEGSITFCIQNKEIENRGLANNIVTGGAFIAGSNIFPQFNSDQISTLEHKLYTDLLPVLQQLQSEGIRGNIGFDIIFIVNNQNLSVKIIEANGIYRPTGSTMPRNFAHNTNNPYFLGIPLGPQLLSDTYASLQPSSMIKLANNLQGLSTIPGDTQMMNIRYAGIGSVFPGVRIAIAGPDPTEFMSIISSSNICNNAGNRYIKELLKKLSL